MSVWPSVQTTGSDPAQPLSAVLGALGDNNAVCLGCHSAVVPCALSQVFRCDTQSNLMGGGLTDRDLGHC